MKDTGEGMDERLTEAISGDRAAFSALTEPHRRELLTHCYRMLGSLQEAEDLVQETLLRAWRRLDTFAGRSALRTWLYKIATNACLDALKRRPRRALPQHFRRASDAGEPLSPPILDPIWIEPFPDELLAPPDAGPEARYEVRESISLAFLTALQTLPPRQRVVLILCDVLDWSLREAGELLGATPVAVNSALYRARSRLSGQYSSAAFQKQRKAQMDPETEALLERYVQAWETADIDALVDLLKEDATFPMPPLPLWYRGRNSIQRFIAATILGGEARGRWRLQPVRSNGQPGFAWYRRDESSGQYEAYAIQVLTIQDGLLADITTFGFPNLFPFFGLAIKLDA
jgi:RNA polymerase sigma-70 factor, ECF subfamily